MLLKIASRFEVQFQVALHPIQTLYFRQMRRQGMGVAPSYEFTHVKIEKKKTLPDILRRHAIFQNYYYYLLNNTVIQKFSHSIFNFSVPCFNN